MAGSHGSRKRTLAVSRDQCIERQDTNFALQLSLVLSCQRDTRGPQLSRKF